MNLIILLVMLIAYGDAFSAFDCTSPDVTITRLDRTAVQECDTTPRNITEEKVNVQLVQISSRVPVHVVACRVRITRQITYCGMNSYSSTVDKGFADYVLDITREQCENAHKTGSLLLHGNHLITELATDGVNTRVLTLAGSITSGGSCSGALYSDRIGTWENVVVTASVEITLTTRKAIADPDTDSIHLGTGTTCVLSKETCTDLQTGNNFWETLSKEACSSEKHIVIYQGVARQITDCSSSDYPVCVVSYLVEHVNRVWSLRRVGTYQQCLFKVWKTEHPSLLVVPQTDAGFAFKTTVVDPASMDLMVYLNAKFVYLDRTYGENIRSLHHAFAQQRCLQDLKTKETQLAMASHDPDEFAYLYAGGPGYTAQVLGEAVYLIKCVVVDVLYRKTDQCFIELPVNSNNVSRFMKPRSHILVDYGTQIDCNPVLLPMYKIGLDWYTVSTTMTQAVAPKQIKTVQDKVFEYRPPVSLAKGGIYDEKEVQSVYATIMFPIERGPTLNTLSRAISGHSTDQQGLSIKPLMSPDVVEDIESRLTTRLWKSFTIIGNITSGFLGIVVVAKIIKWVMDMFVNARIIYEIYGVSARIFCAAFDSLTTLMVHRNVAHEVPTYRRHRRNDGPMKEEEGLVDHPVAPTAPLDGNSNVQTIVYQGEEYQVK